MKILLFFSLLSLPLLAQSQKYEEVEINYPVSLEMITPDKSILTETMKAKALKALKIAKPTDYVVLATRMTVPERNLAFAKILKTNAIMGWVVYDNTENITQTTWFRVGISAATQTKIKTAAYAKGLSKTDPNIDIMKISNKTGTWYQVIGMVKDNVQMMILSETFVVVSVKGLEEGH